MWPLILPSTSRRAENKSPFQKETVSIKILSPRIADDDSKQSIPFFFFLSLPFPLTTLKRAYLVLEVEQFSNNQRLNREDKIVQYWYSPEYTIYAKSEFVLFSHN